MSRHALPDRRDLVRQKVTIAGRKLYVDLGFYDQERTKVGELFIVLEKTGSRERALFDEIGRSASKRLQYGEPLEDLAEDWLGTRFAPAGVVVGADRIKLCTSPLDYVARMLLIGYCGREDLAHKGGT